MRYLFSAFLLVSLVAGSGCGKRFATGVSIDPAFTRLIPPDSKVLVGIQVDRLKTSPFYQRHQKELDIPLLNAFSERVGVDPRRDLSDLLIAWNGKQPVFMARGRFNPRQLQQKLGSLGAQRKTYKTHTVFGTDKESLIFMDKGVAVAGSAGALRTLIDLRDSRQAGVPDELHQRLAALPKGDQIWLVSRQGLPFMEVPMRSDIGSAISNIVADVTGVSLGIRVETGTDFEIEIDCISDQGAQRVRDALRGGIGLARLTTKDNQLDLLRLYDSIHVDQDRQVIHVRADLAGDLADKLLAYLPQIQGRAGQFLQNER